MHVLPEGKVPQTHHVRGTNFNHIAVFPDRIPGRAIVISGERASAGMAWSGRPAWVAAEHGSNAPTPPPLLAVIDNLVKGASGQAVQNLNLMSGIPETTGLMQQALYP